MTQPEGTGALQVSFARRTATREQLSEVARGLLNRFLEEQGLEGDSVQVAVKGGVAIASASLSYSSPDGESGVVLVWFFVEKKRGALVTYNHQGAGDTQEIEMVVQIVDSIAFD